MRRGAIAVVLSLFGPLVGGCPRTDRCGSPGTEPAKVVQIAYDAARQADVDGVLRCLTASGRSRLVGPPRAALFGRSRLIRSVEVRSVETGRGWANVSVVIHETTGLDRPATLRVLEESAGLSSAWLVDSLAVP